jgi:hypothetical protein
MSDFEERLYNHWMYTNVLSNMINDIDYEIREAFGNNSISLEKYTSGKYATLTVNDGTSIVAVISHIEYVRHQDNYYKDLRFKVEDNKIIFYIEI